MIRIRRGVAFALAVAAMAAPVSAQDAPDERISSDGQLRLDGVEVPLSSFMSEEGRDYLRRIILDKPFGRPASDIAAERARQDEIMAGFLDPMRRRYAVNVAEDRIAGIVVDVVTPADGVAPENSDLVLINVHGGGFVTGARSASLVESVPLAALMKIKVVSIDYRMGPEHQFPAASEDVAAVYRELLKSYRPSQIGLYGCSAGGLVTAQSIAWFLEQDLPLPAAIGVFCASFGPFGGGDSGALAGPLNGILPAIEPGPAGGAPPSYGPGYLDDAKLDDPLAYPAASQEMLAAFPPTLFISGTRSFEFSAALDSHNRLTRAGVESRFHGWDGMFHGFIYNSELPESREAYAIMADFFRAHLAD